MTAPDPPAVADYASPPGPEPTLFIEANALLALDDGDEHEARRILADMGDAELGILGNTAWKLYDLCSTLAAERRTR